MLTSQVLGTAAGSCTTVDLNRAFGVDNTRLNPMPHATPFATPTLGQSALRRPHTAAAPAPALPCANATSLTQSLPLPPKTAPSAGPRGPQLPPLQPHGGGAKSRLAATTRLNSYVAATAPLNERLAMSNEVAMSRTHGRTTNLFKLGRPWSPRRSEPARSWRPQTSG